MNVAGWSFTRCSGLCWQGSNIRQRSSERDGEYGRIFWRAAGVFVYVGVVVYGRGCQVCRGEFG